MTTQTTSALDIELYKSAFESWDVETLLDFYDDEVELTMVSANNPPSSPREQRGKEVFRGMFEHCRDAGATPAVENGISDGDRASMTVTCVFPGGRKVVANNSVEVRDGRIVREHEVIAGD
jgi:ketosteroid isomerase-like protein